MLLLDGGVDPLDDEEDELNRLAQDLAAGAAAATVVVAGGGGGGAYGVGTMMGGGTDRSGGGPGGGRGVFICWMSRWGMASTFLDSMTGPGLTTAGVGWCSTVELPKDDFCGAASGCL